MVKTSRERSSARLVAKTDEIFNKDLCFQLQQAIEKAIKALLVYNDIEPPIPHSFALLIRELRNILEVPEEMERVIELEDYSVQTRYPGNYTPVDETEYRDASQIATIAMDWIRSKIK